VIDVAKLRVQIERVFDLGWLQHAPDVRVSEKQLLEVALLVERAHRVALHPFVRLLTRHAALRELEQHRPRKHHTARTIHVLAHALGIDHHARDDACEAAQHVIEGDEAVRQDHAFDRRMRDVALVPERVVLEPRDRIAAQQPREPLSRAALRTGGFWLSSTGLAGAVVGGLQEATRASNGRPRRRFPTALPAAAVLAGANAVRVHRAAAADADMPDLPSASLAKSVAYGTAVAAGASAFALTERSLASAIARSAARVLPGRREVWQPLGHAATLAAFGALARLLVERAFAGIESKETAVESAFDVAPPNPLVSGSRASLVPFHTLSRQGGRFVWTVTTQQQIEAVVGEPAVAMPIRVYAGLASAEDEQSRVDLLLAHLF